MAQRHVTMDLRQIADFLKTHTSSLAAGAVLVPASAIDGELAPEFRVEIELPFGQRTPAIRCQIIQRLPDGSVAGQIPEMPAKAKGAFDAVLEGISQVRAHLLETGELVEPGAALAAPAPGPATKETPAQAAAPVEGAVPEAPPDLPEQAEAPDEVASDADLGPVPVATPEAPPTPEFQRSHPEGLLLPPEYADAEPSDQGQLGGRALRQQVMVLGFTQATGILHIQEADGTERFGFWLRGGPVGWRRTPAEPRETLGGLLLRSKAISEDDLTRALGIQAESGERLGQILIAEGLLPAERLGPVLSKQVEFTLQLALRAREGSFRFVPCELGQPFAVSPLNVLELLFGAMAGHGRTLSPDRIFGVIRPQLNKRLNLLPSAEHLIEGASWGEGERLLLDTLQSAGGLVRNFFNQVDLPRAEVAVVLWALSELGVLSFGKGGEGFDKARYLKQITGPIQERVAYLEHANPFDALGLSWICAQGQVDRAFKSWQSRFDAERFDVLSVELRGQLAQIQQAHEAAYEAIATQAKRRALRLEMIGEEGVQEAAALLSKQAESAQDPALAARARAKAGDLHP